MQSLAKPMRNPYLPHTAKVVERIQETHTVFTLRLALPENELGGTFKFKPGQFNMLYLFGVGEVPISIVSDPKDPRLLDHAIRRVGRVTRGLSNLQAGDTIGLRGPYGNGWPLDEAEGKDVLVITGGLGCAPVVSVINYIIKRRSRFGRLTILQGVKLPADLIWRDRYEKWVNEPNTEVFIAADTSDRNWPWHVGYVTELFEQININDNTIVLETSSPISDHVRVDFRIWGCPVNERQVVAVLSAVLLGVSPTHETEPVCLECKRQNSICVLVSKGEACLGPVTRSGCGALCPQLARGCYGCNGPADNANTDALVQRFRELGITTESIQRHFQFINSNAPAVSAVIAS